MIGSAVVYLGLVVVLAGLVLLVKPARWLGIGTRKRALILAGAGVLVAAVGFLLPAPESRVARAETRLDEFAPVWQFSEFHELAVDASPERAFDAIKNVTANDIFLFQTLTWIRRAGQTLPEGVLNAPENAPILDVALRGGFVLLAEQPPQEIVIGAVVSAPAGTRGSLTPEVFRRTLPDGFALAAMNFRVRPDGAGGSIVTTETRVFASGPSAKRQFAGYWRIIYPGSALIRRMWLRAIRGRAEAGGVEGFFHHRGHRGHREGTEGWNGWGRPSRLGGQVPKPKNESLSSLRVLCVLCGEKNLGGECGFGRSVGGRRRVGRGFFSPQRTQRTQRGDRGLEGLGKTVHSRGGRAQKTWTSLFPPCPLCPLW